jgi:hypothetical protein
VSSAPARHNPSADRAAATREDKHPGADQLIDDVGGCAGMPRAHGNPGGLGQMSSRSSAIWRSSSIDSSRFGTGAESYGWSRLTSLENVLSSPLLFCSGYQRRRTTPPSRCAPTCPLRHWLECQRCGRRKITPGDTGSNPYAQGDPGSMHGMQECRSLNKSRADRQGKVLSRVLLVGPQTRR